MTWKQAGRLIVVSLATLAFNAWVLMLVLGALRSADDRWPAYGYTTTALLVVASNLLFKTPRRKAKQ